MRGWNTAGMTTTRRSRARQARLRRTLVVGGLVAVALGVTARSCLTSIETADRRPAAARGTTTSTPSKAATSTRGTSSGTRSATPSATATATAAAPAHPGVIRLAFAGDVHFDENAAALLDDPDSLDELKAVLGPADIAVVNLEMAITERGTKEAKLFHFRAPPKSLAMLDRAGVDVGSMANNHAVDYGPLGLTDSLAARQASPIKVIGIGKDRADAFAPAVFTVQGVTVAVIASTQVNDLTVNKYPATTDSPGVAGNLTNGHLLEAVRTAVASYDVVVVFLHWGTEKTTCPDGAQFATAQDLETAGADVIVGAHAHRVQGAGWLGRSYVGYGLGNFVWHLREEQSRHSGVLTVNVDVAAATQRGKLRGSARADAPSLVSAATWSPLYVGLDGVPRAPESKTTRAALAQEWRDRRSCTQLSSTPPA